MITPEQRERRRQGVGSRGQSMLRHGEAKRGHVSVEYRVWLLMRQRCRESPNYINAGITVCSRWDIFEAFLVDMGRRPSSKHSIDRIDNARGYSPGNCRWATRGEQNRNTRRTILVCMGGKTLCLKDWAAELGRDYETVRKRYARGVRGEMLFAEGYVSTARGAK